MFVHVPVLLKEAIDGLKIKSDGIYIDATLGGGGHSSCILKQLKTGHLYCFDQDEDAIKAADQKLKSIGKNYTIINRNFRYIKEELSSRGVYEVNGVLFDLGVSSYQFDEASRGFSYNYDALLDMRMDQRNKLTAYTIVNEWDYQEIITILYRYADEAYAKNITRKIVDVRKHQPIKTTFELVEVIKSALPASVLRKKDILQRKHFKH